MESCATKALPTVSCTRSRLAIQSPSRRDDRHTRLGRQGEQLSLSSLNPLCPCVLGRSIPRVFIYRILQPVPRLPEASLASDALTQRYTEYRVRPTSAGRWILQTPEADLPASIEQLGRLGRGRGSVPHVHTYSTAPVGSTTALRPLCDPYLRA